MKLVSIKRVESQRFERFIQCIELTQNKYVPRIQKKRGRFFNEAALSVNADRAASLKEHWLN